MLWKLDGQQINHHIFLKFSKMIGLSINYQLIKKKSIYFSLEIRIFCDIVIQNSSCLRGSCSLKIAMTIYAAIFLIHFRKNVFDEIFFLMELLYITNDF